jgi:Trk-type K+ transport system membrane component
LAQKLREKAQTLTLRFRSCWTIHVVVSYTCEFDQIKYALDISAALRFPSHQTWFLVVCLFAFSAVEWISFEVLDSGLEVTDSIPVGSRIVAGLFQGLAARASGFSIVAVANLAPAVQ